MQKPRLHYLQHVAFEDSAHIKEWADERGLPITRTLLGEGEKLPPLDSFDWLTVLGGPMSTYDEDQYAWLIEEKRFIKQAIDAGKVVIGICLGHQLLSEALGGKVYPNKHKEIGWHEIELTDDGKKHPFFITLPEKFTIMQWHGDTCDIPKGAIHLARSHACENQSFVYGDKVLGLQFHMEFNEAVIKRLVAHCGAELSDNGSSQGNFIQSKEEILNLEHVSTLNKRMDTLLDYIHQHFFD